MPTSIPLCQRPRISIWPCRFDHYFPGSENGDEETSIHRPLNANVAVVGEPPIEGRRIDVPSESGGGVIPNEHAFADVSLKSSLIYS